MKPHTFAGIALAVATAAGPAAFSPARAQDPAPDPLTRSAEAPFLAETSAGMDRMMAGMGVTPTGDVDADFAAMMIPHHQGAIDMALAELRHGKNEQLRRIAQEIIVDQQQEIAAMRLAVGKPLPPSEAAQTQVSHSAADQPGTPAHHHAAPIPSAPQTK